MSSPHSSVLALLVLHQTTTTTPTTQSRPNMSVQAALLVVGVVVVVVCALFELSRRRAGASRPRGDRVGPYHLRTFARMSNEEPRLLLSNVPMGDEDILVSDRFTRYWRVPRIAHSAVHTGYLFDIMMERAVAKLANHMAVYKTPVHAIGKSCKVVVEALQRVRQAAVGEIHLSTDACAQDLAWMHAMCARLEAGDVRVFVHLRRHPKESMCRLFANSPMLSVCLHDCHEDFFAGDLVRAERLF